MQEDPGDVGTVRCDVAVVGAGPAGAACALVLARAGLDARVIDRHPPPRYKTCGGGLVGRSVRRLTVPIDGVVERECRVAELRFLDAGLVYRVERETPLVTMTMRADLDARLLDAAVDAGAGTLLGREVSAVERRGDRVAVETRHPAGVGRGCGREWVEARFVIAADGALGRTALAAGWPAHAAVAPALECELWPAGSPDGFLSAARFDFLDNLSGYAWVFPKREHLSVGLLSTCRGRRDLRSMLEGYLERIGLTALRREDHGFVIPLAPRSPLARDRVLLVGDAAGLADPVTCEGIGNALLSGRLAAEAIVSAPDRPRDVERRYLRTVRREVETDLWIARRLATLLYRRPRIRTAVFRRAGGPLCEAFADIVAGTIDYRGLLASPRRWSRFLSLLVSRV